MKRRVVVQWTDTAKSQLAKLEPKVRRDILKKAGALRTCGDPREAHKPLVGPLEGFYRITYARYRAVYTVEDEKLDSGETRTCIRVLFVAVGKRKERDRQDIYRIAERIVKLGLIDIHPREEEADEPDR